MSSFTRSRYGRGLAALVVSAGLLAGVAGTAHVSAQVPVQPPAFTFPLTKTAANLLPNASTTSTVTELAATSAAAAQGFTINLRGATPNATYAIQGCYSNPSLLDNRSCASPAPATVTTDPSGNATATVYFNTTNLFGVIDTITVTNNANSADAYQAVVSGVVIGELPAVNIGLPNFVPPLFIPSTSPQPLPGNI